MRPKRGIAGLVPPCAARPNRLQRPRRLVNTNRWTPWLIALLVITSLLVVWWLSAIFMPVLVALVLAWVLLPPAAGLATRLGSRKRAAAVLIGGMGAGLLVVTAVAIPMLVHEGHHWAATATGEGNPAIAKDLSQLVAYGDFADPDAEQYDGPTLAAAAQKSGAPADVVRVLKLAQPPVGREGLRLADAVGDRDGDGRLEPGYAKRYKQLSRDRKSWIGAVLHWLDKNGLIDQGRRLAQKAIERDQLAKLWAGGTLSAAGDVGLRILGSVRQAMATALALTIGALLVPIYMFFFILVLPDWQQALPNYLPADSRHTWLRVLGRIGAAIAGFVRGRIVVCSIVALLTAVGWLLLGVRLGLLLGLAVGALTVVPLANVIALVPALLICVLDVASGVHGWGWFGAVIAVYVLGQIAESVLNPIIVGDAVQLDMVTIIVAFFVGAAVAGLVGLLLAVPVAATLRILAEELVLPRWRQWADSRIGADPAWNPTATGTPTPASPPTLAPTDSSV
ncbi:MAG: AI-2E family transporter [Myxococcales bacterium]|nr:AI-2E family transporter [Myxococcales bacterium]